MVLLQLVIAIALAIAVVNVVCIVMLFFVTAIAIVMSLPVLLLLAPVRIATHPTRVSCLHPQNFPILHGGSYAVINLVGSRSE